MNVYKFIIDHILYKNIFVESIEDYVVFLKSPCLRI